MENLLSKMGEIINRRYAGGSIDIQKITFPFTIASVDKGQYSPLSTDAIVFQAISQKGKAIYNQSKEEIRDT